jgi:rhamnosyltransferase subunit B
LSSGCFRSGSRPPQPDWPPNTHLTGFILHDDDGRAALPADVEEFLQAGPKPILVTPGSAAMDRVRFFRTTVDACRASGVRAMLVTNFPGQLPSDLPEGIRAFSYLPFSRVLPRCAAVAYHGGIGTLAQAVNAGIPHLVVSNSYDQPDNGQRIDAPRCSASALTRGDTGHPAPPGPSASSWAQSQLPGAAASSRRGSIPGNRLSERARSSSDWPEARGLSGR